MKNPIKQLLIFLIKSYRLTVSPWFSGGSCRFTPTCSQYAIEALQVHGVIKGSALAAWRIMRCNPFSKGGWDPVPPKKTKRNNNE